MIPGMNTITKQPLATDKELFTLAHALSPTECAKMIALAEAQGFGEAPVTVGVNRYMMIPDLRNNKRVMLDAPQMAHDLWPRLETYMPKRIGAYYPVGLNERFRFYRYESGQQFDWHRDGSFVRSDEEQSFLTMMFYLNEDCEGGTTDFMFVADDELHVVPQTGMGLVFSHPLYHRGAPVISGKKYVLRTDVMYRRAVSPYFD
jgi:predicted 2-oxoglutarate/Fe(II)-dependent dioxygenase YbiX